jgi:hypothetical protein
MKTSYNCLSSITFLGNSQLESIASSAFAYTLLTTITIPDTVTTIGTDAFCDSQLANITFAENSKLTSIGGYRSFAGTQLTSITIPTTVTTIGSGAFLHCHQLTNIIFSRNSQLESIGEEAFVYTSLTSITIPDTINNISTNAFSYYEDWDVNLEYYHICPIQSITVNCSNTSGNNIIGVLNKMYDSHNGKAKDDCCQYIQILKIALSSSLLETKSFEQILEYVEGILNILPTDNVLINALLNKSGLFELDLSNTNLNQNDIAGMPKTLPWTVIADGERKTYAIQE